MNPTTLRITPSEVTSLNGTPSSSEEATPPQPIPWLT